MNALHELPQLNLPLVHRGKVRDLYDAGDGLLLMVASDRISAFDVIMAEPVPDKGRVLTAMSVFWFEQFADLIGNHVVSYELSDMPTAAQLPELAGRTLLVRRAEMLPVECIVRGYLAGSGWKEYRATGTLHGTPLPAGLTEAARLPEPMYTPSTKGEVGEHDENISPARAAELIGDPELAAQAASVVVEIYRRAAAIAEPTGIIVADTKFELGVIDGRLVIADEALTPDSSRFWPADQWTPGANPPSFDKQPVRDYLDRLDWAKVAPAPPLPVEVIEATAHRYRHAYEWITGRSLADWPGA